MIDVSKEVQDILDTYSEEVKKQQMEAAKDTAKACASELKSLKHEKTARASGSYDKGWAVKKLKDGYVVYNKEKPRLTHLLNNGYAKHSRNGTTGGRVQGDRHLDEANEKFGTIYVQAVERRF